MPTLMQRAAGVLGDRLKSAAGHVGTYTRGDTEVAATSPVAAKTYDKLDSDGLVIGSVLSYDWTFKAEDLEGLEPRGGDLWRPTINGTAEVYEVVEINGRAFERLDTSGVLLTVHTNKVG
jgi:hypothetical protein